VAVNVTNLPVQPSGNCPRCCHKSFLSLSSKNWSRNHRARSVLPSRPLSSRPRSTSKVNSHHHLHLSSVEVVSVRRTRPSKPERVRPTYIVRRVHRSPRRRHYLTVLYTLFPLLLLLLPRRQALLSHATTHCWSFTLFYVLILFTLFYYNFLQ
jgi:hypothetical protein